MAPIDELDYTNPITLFMILFLFYRFFPGLLHAIILCAAAFIFPAYRNTKCPDAAAEAPCVQSVRRNAHERHLCTEVVEMPVDETREVKLSIEDVRTMMEALDCECGEQSGAEIEGLFEEELRLGEVKEAFDLFDDNGDGFIDAEDLKKVLCAMGFTVASEVDRCRRMISGFDSNGDGRLDFEEFVKLVEQSFC